MAISSIDMSSLLSYYTAQTNQAVTNAVAHSNTTSTTTSGKTGATANDVTPWTKPTPTQQARDAQVLSTTNFIDSTNVPLLAGSATDTKMEQDNQKLFSLYNAINNVSYLATIAKRDTTTDGQRAGYNTRFQAGLQQIQSYISNTSFNLFSLQAQPASSTVTSTATVAMPSFDYTGSVVASGANVASALSGVSSSDSFNIAVKKGSTTTNVAIDLSKVQGDLSLGNIVQYVNQQLAAGGFTTRFAKDLVSGNVDGTAAVAAKAQYAMQIVPGGTEQVSLSATSAPALYVSGTSGLTASTTDSAADSQGRLTKLSNLSDPVSEFSRSMAVSVNTASIASASTSSASSTASSTSSTASTSTSTTSAMAPGTSTANATVVDSSGNVYMLGDTSGNVGSQINQGAQDTYLTKYDSAGKQLWSKLVGSAGTADGASMALNPQGGVVVVGSTTANLTTTAIGNGNQDSYAIKYDASGNQVWTAQIPSLNKNSANAVSVDTSGNVYIGGQTNGVIASGQSSAGKQDAYVVKLDSTGKTVYKQQFGTSGSDSVAATTTTANGDLLVASVQNGHAIVSKYAGGDATKAPTWSMDMGDLQSGGTIGGIVVKDNNIYISGTTRNGALNATASNTASGGSDAYVFSATDNGNSVTANHVSYVGTSGNEQGAGLTVGTDGTVYLAGSTNATFAGQSRNLADTSNMFVAAVSSSGSVNWVKQYGGADGQSTGTGVAFSSGGASVLDALGLPSGSVSGQQNSDLAAATTLRPGDSFKVQITGDAGRTFSIAIDKGETLNSLVTKINAQFGSKGKASVTYSSTGAALKIQVNAGTTAKLISGPANSDALGRLGISAQTMSAPSTTSSSTSTASTSTSNTYSLGFSTNLNISTTTGAGAARAQLLNVLSALQKVYQQSNTSTSTASTASAASTAKMSAAAASYNSNLSQNMSVALSLLQA
ncbi:MAG: SBBP repeat-containing protein [Rhizomicrobium sp.]|nr:SBBP repeat-containing protein [Rhizomicrobium sp.]